LTEPTINFILLRVLNKKIEIEAMQLFKKRHIPVSILVLVCFFTALTGAFAFAGHDCCGKCGEGSPQHPMPAKSARVSADCCPAKTECACTFQQENGRNTQAYSVSYVRAPCDALPAGLPGVVSGKNTDNNIGQAAFPATLSKIQKRSGPIYLTNQCFLC
jgi:hypothetical protein